MIDLTIVEWGGPKGGGGFLPYLDPHRRPAGKPFQKAARALIYGDVDQPPEEIPDSDRHPVWSLRCVQVEAVGPHWCFAVQGRGGAFGRVGSCQFAFAPADVEPGQVWATGVHLVGADGRLGHGPAPRAPRGAIGKRQISGVLTGLAQGRRRIAVEGAPVDVAAAIARLLAVVPVEDVRDYVWTTYLLRRPVGSKRLTVAGRWPTELRASNAAKVIDRWLDAGSGEPFALSLHPRWLEAVSWLTDHTVSGAEIDPSYRLLSGMTDLLDTIMDAELGFRLEDVAAQLDTDADRLRFGTGPELIRQWAVAQPRDAIGRLLDPAGPSWLDEFLFDGVLEANRRAAAGQNPALLPPADEYPFTGWHSQLVRLVRGRYVDQAAMADFVRRELMVPGRPMADRKAVEQAIPWLQELGLSPDGPASGIFPVPTQRIVRELAELGGLGTTNRRLLAGSADFVGEARRVVNSLGYVPASVGIVLFQVAAVDARQDQSVVGDLARHLLQHNDQYFGDGYLGDRPPACDTWLEQVLDGDLPPSTKNLLVDIGGNHLAQRGPKSLPAAFLRRVLELRADEPGVGVATRRILLDSAEYLRAAAEQESTPRYTAGPVNPRPAVPGARSRPDGAGVVAVAGGNPRQEWEARSSRGILDLLIFIIIVVVIIVMLALFVDFLLNRY